ncbi:NEL-type E3 ubiquitin ligase domain-containing protein [Pseudomonas sp. NPDC089392]|uniref:NEL-type E3 ubiquitin ligase domain-containing protein n=1 Tax=Pseudomonas sp. NPDC089392 TaxID=3364459 RepID=UPI00382FDD9E
MTTHSLPAHDSIDHLIAQGLPDWMKVPATDQADAQRKHTELSAYHRALRAQQECAERLNNLLGAIPSLEAFAAPRLKQALADAGLANIDPFTRFVVISQELHYRSVGNKFNLPYRVIHSRQTLLAAALHNFHEDETESSIFRVARLENAHKAVLPMAFERFAKLCRQLDLGGAYQQLLAGVLAPKGRPDLPEGNGRREVEKLFQDNLRARLEAAVHEARIKGELDRPLYQRLLPLFTAKSPEDALRSGISARQLYLLGKPVIGVVTLRIHAQEGGAQAVVAWIPDDPQGALTVHDSWDSLYAVLGRRLHQPEFRRFFTRFIKERDRVAFYSTLAALLRRSTSPGALQLDGRNLAIDKTCFSHVRELQIAKIYDDARCLAVPTGDEDMSDRQHRLEAMIAAGFDLLGLIGMFIPVIGDLMLVVSAVQVVDEIYEGFQDWRLGDRQGALDHAIGVAASLVLFTATSTVVPVLSRRLFIDGLTPVVSGTTLKLANSPLAAQEQTSLAALMESLQGRLPDDLLETEARTLLDVTGMSEAQLRRLSVEQAPPSARLLDNWQRFMAYRDDPTLAVEALEAQLTSSDDSVTHGQVSLMNTFGGLTVRGARQVLEQSSSVHVEQLLKTGRASLAMAERARRYAQDSRIDRACLGIRLREAVNSDTERLVLRLIERKLPWPDDLRIELRDGSPQGLLLLSSGLDGATRVKTIVRDQRRYRLADGLDDTGVGLSWLAAVNQCLDDTQKAAAGNSRLSLEQLRDWLLASASADRDQAAELVGIVRHGVGVRPPQRFADGRLGFALSGGGESSHQAIRRGIHQIFPTLSDLQLQAYMDAVRQRGENLWDHYQMLQRQLTDLREALRQWQGEWQSPVDAIRRRRVADVLRRSWRRKLVDVNEQYELVIDGEHVDALPSLPADIDFVHVRRLTLRNMGLQVIDAAFLSRFPNLIDLDLSGNRLTQIPEGIEGLTQLRRVTLGNNQISLDAAGNARLSSLHRLDTLVLSFNPLNGIPDLSGLPNIRDLRLRSTGQVSLDQLHESVVLRAHVDLRDNRISELQHEMHDLRLRLQRLSLHDNPLSERSARRLDAARGVTATGEQGSALHVHQSVDADTRAAWVAHRDGTLRSERGLAWDRLVEEPGSEGLFRFLADFSSSEDFERHPSHYRERIWRILSACEHNEALREQLFREADAPRSCQDRLLLMLNQLEVGILVHLGVEGVPAAAREGRLLRLGRQLHRLDLLDEIANQHVQAMRRADVEAVDEIEVRLLYRSRLAGVLELPVQPDEMHYAFFAHVSVADLTQAEMQVLRADTTAAMLDSLSERPFWQHYLREAYPARFEALAIPFHDRLERLETQARDGQEGGYAARASALMNEHALEEQALMRILTTEAWARASGQGSSDAQ